MKREGHFNGHTWIIVLTSIVGLLIIGFGALVGIFLVLFLKDSQDMTLKLLEMGSVPIIPFTVIKGIIAIVERMTYIPKKDTP